MECLTSVFDKLWLSLNWIGLSIQGNQGDNGYQSILSFIFMLFRVWLLNSILFCGEIYILIKDMYQDYYNKSKYSH